MLEWAFDNQAELRELGKDPERVYARIAKQFPQLAGCLGKPAVQVEAQPVAALGGRQLAAGRDATAVRSRAEDL